MREDDPSQEHPELGISCPQALPPHKDVHCGQRPERAERERGREREKEKRGRRYPGQITQRMRCNDI